METIQKLQFKSLGSAEKSGTPAEFGGLSFKSIFPDGAPVPAPAPVVEQPKAPVFVEKDILESRQKGYEDGYAKGYAGAKSDEAETAKKIQVSLDDITIKLAAMGEALKTRNEMNIQNMVVLALKIARKVAGTALKNDPYTEIENIFLANIHLLFEEPTISISVNPELVENITQRISTLAKIEGFKNNIEVSGNPALGEGSCDVKWNGGGIRSNKDEVWNQIEELCESL